MDLSIIILVSVFVLFIAFIAYVIKYSKGIDWSKGKKIKDPTDKMKGGLR